VCELTGSGDVDSRARLNTVELRFRHADDRISCIVQQADRGLSSDKPKTSRIEDKTVSAAESFSGLPENPLAEPTSIC
jgi:hypothetical protein